MPPQRTKENGKEEKTRNEETHKLISKKGTPSPGSSLFRSVHRRARRVPDPYAAAWRPPSPLYRPAGTRPSSRAGEEERKGKRKRERKERKKREKEVSEKRVFLNRNTKRDLFFFLPSAHEKRKNFFFSSLPRRRALRSGRASSPAARRGRGRAVFFFFGLRWRWRKRLKVRKKLVSLILHSIRRIGIEDGLCFPFALTVATEERL
jgi:hypothetical protein